MINRGGDAFNKTFRHSLQQSSYFLTPGTETERWEPVRKRPAPYHLLQSHSIPQGDVFWRYTLEPHITFITRNIVNVQPKCQEQWVDREIKPATGFTMNGNIS